jgi:hypothetical protein
MSWTRVDFSFSIFNDQLLFIILFNNIDLLRHVNLLRSRLARSPVGRPVAAQQDSLATTFNDWMADLNFASSENLKSLRQAKAEKEK